ncbi:hypothetical protein GCM10023144_16020 [Pigmentiphaga soli]|uniref:Zn-ribbon domain-containing OB-fold protein n=1 Tax=Pigmentiphaga soli TaxID=1007095 RepID=A0ABP8GSJ0_9BURK
MATSQPRTDTFNQPYWAALREGRLCMPRCRQCHRLQYPMGPCCSNCLSADFDWVALSGRGRVHAYAVYHHAFHPSFRDRLPYNVAEVLLEEGVKVISNIVGIAHDAIRNDMPVRARFDPVDEDLTLLRFEPAADG